MLVCHFLQSAFRGRATFIIASSDVLQKWSWGALAPNCGAYGSNAIVLSVGEVILHPSS